MEKAPDSIKDKLRSHDQFRQLKLKIYKGNVEDHLRDGAQSHYKAERQNELKEKNGMLDLGEMSPNSEVDQARD